MIFILIKSFSESSCPVDGGGVKLKATTPIRIEMFCCRIKVLNYNNVIYSRLEVTISSKRTSGPKLRQQLSSCLTVQQSP